MIPSSSFLDPPEEVQSSFYYSLLLLSKSPSQDGIRRC